ncbi:Ig-like domain-containing protein [Pseudomonas mangiferae]|uniref:Tandem-95 repeat protein n=1 Tax=Pseudomonas mangiferae TaxID=2593654 RepID=A0A553H450_9PSED|nr:Ig-like domain-containing protein [Pseudomonas mangiferae]TRX76530.1 tandem-95 repeat protein [Pseudomonas mangiferae]
MHARHAHPSALRIALEPRLMFDGAMVATADATTHPDNAAAAAAAAEASEHQAAAAHEALSHALAAVPPAPPAADRQEIYFVDANLPDRDVLVAALPSQAEIVYLNRDADGLLQIADALRGRSGIDAIHLVTHTAEATLQLGNVQLTTESILGRYSEQLGEIGQHLNSGADVLIYGCDLAAGDDGQATLQALADTLVADVAASDNTTGAGGDWVLERHVGTIETTPFHAEDWNHQLLVSVPVNDTVTVLPNSTGNVIAVLANDIIVAGTTVSVANVTTPAHGTVVLNANNTISYTPTANYSGTDSFTYTMRDSLGLSLGTATVSVTVDAPPTLQVPTLGTYLEDASIVFSSALGTRITVADIDNTTTQVTLSVPSGSLTLGSLTGLTFLQGDGVADPIMTLRGTIAAVNAALNGLVYTPVADFNGSVNLTVSVTDSLTAAVTSSVPMTFTPVADIVPDAVSTLQNNAVTFNVLSNDTFSNPGRVVSAYGAPAHGTVVIDAAGNAVYTPAAGYAGTDTFTYTVSSGGVTETGSITVTTYINSPPTISVPAAQTFAEDVTRIFSSSAGNAITVADANGDILTVTLQSTHGSLTLAQFSGLTFLTGTGVGNSLMVFRGSASAINAALNGLSFTPVPDYYGGATLSIQASDGIAAVQSANVALNLTPVVNGVPDSIQTGPLTPVTFLPLANDTFLGTPSVTAVSAPSHGTVVLLNNAITYTPAAGFTGSDTFTYTVTSGGATEQVVVNVTVGDTPPTSVSLGTLSTVDGGLVAVSAALAFRDPDPLDVLTYSASGLPAGLSINATTGIISGLVNTHASTVNGGVYNVVVTATDLAGASASSTLQLRVSNPAPIPLLGLQVGGSEDSLLGISASALGIIDPDGDAFSITQASALHGTVTINADGSLSYMPNANYFGLDTITYTVTDVDGGSATGYVAVVLAAVPDLPVLNLPSIPLLAEDTPLVFANLAGQQLSVLDVDGETLQLSLNVPLGSLTLTQTAGLTFLQGDGIDDSVMVFTGSALSINAALSSLIYTPGADYNGPVNINLALSQITGGLLSVNATLPISIAPVADIVNDTVSTALNTPALFNVLTNDSFENPGRVVSSFTNPSHGSVTLDAQGNAVYTPASGYVGSDSFTYTVTSNGTTETATVTISIAQPNVAPTLSTPPGQTSAEDTPLVFSSAAGNAIVVADANGDVLTVSLQVTQGTLTLSRTNGLTFSTGDGTTDASLVFSGSAAAINAALDGLTFNPVADYNGAATLTLSVSDGLLSQAGSVALTITPVADGVPDSIQTGPLVPVIFYPLANDNFEGLPRITAVTQGAHGTVTLGLGGAVTYTPALGYTGSDTFFYTVTSGGVTEQIAVNVTVGNHAPTTSGPLGTLNTLDGALVAASTAQAFSDADALDVLSYSATGLPAGLSIDRLTGLITGVVDTHASVHGANGSGLYTVTVRATDLAGASVSTTLQIQVGNPPPVPLVGLSVNALEDTPLLITANTLAIIDPDGDALTLTAASALHGSVTINPDGSLNYVPSANFNGLDRITYTVVDADGGQATGYVAVVVVAVPDLPILQVPNLVLLAEDTPLLFANILGQRLSVGDVDGEVLDLRLSVPIGSFTLTQTAGLSISEGDGVDDSTLRFSGSVADINAALDGLIYTPGADYNGPLAITLQLGRLVGGILNVNATLPIQIAPVADIVDDSVNVTLDTPVGFNVLANDTFENAGRYVSGFTTPAHGTLTLDAQGNALYTPTSGYLGTDSFTYTVTSNGTTETATVTLTTALPNYAPTVLAPAAQAAQEDTPLIFSSAAGNALVVADANGDLLTITLQVTHGTLTLAQTAGLSFTSGDGVADASMVFRGSAAAINAALDGLTFAPVADYNGSATLNILASDGQLSQSASTALTLAAVADAVPDTVQTQPLVPVTFYPLTNDTFSNPDAALTAVSAAAHGSVVIGPGGALIYTPAPGYRGVDSFTYTITSGGVTEQATITVVVGTNSAPVAGSLGSLAGVDGGGVLVAAGASFSDSDLFDVLTYLATGLPAGLSIDAATGVISGVLDTHASVQVPGGRYAVTVTATDLAGASASSVLLITVSNPPPVTTPAVATVLEDTPLTITQFSVVDPDNDSIALTAASALHGSVVLNPDGSLTYTPNANYNGLDTITYTVVDADGGRATGVIAVTVLPVVDLPTLQLPTIPLFAEDTPLIFANLVGQQLSVGDVDGELVDLRLSVPIGGFTLTQTAGISISEGDGVDDSTLRISGTVADINAALNGLIYTPGADYNGPLTINLELGQLGLPLSVTAILPIQIVPVADIVDDHVSTTTDNAVGFNVLANDTFENPGRVVQSFTNPAHGTVTLDAQGNAVYTPDAGFTGTDTFTYTVYSNQTTETATVTVSINAAPNTDPVATALANRTAQDGQSLSLNVSGAFSDTDGDALTYSASGLPAGLAIDPATGIISGTLGGHASIQVPSGAYAIVITADDGHGGQVSAGFTLTVSNPPPTANPDSFSVAEGSVLNGDVLANDSDIDQDSLSVNTTPLQGPAHGTLVLNADGTFIYTPTLNYRGPDSFTYQLVDADGGTASAGVTLTVTPVNAPPAPVGTIAPQVADDSSAFSLNVAGNFTDANGDTLTYSASGLPTGLAIDPASGLISGTLAHDASTQGTNGSGAYTVTVTADDGNGGQVTQTFALSVSNPAPTTAGGSISLAEDTPYNGTLTASDVDGDSLSFAAAQPPAHGSLVLNPDGTFTYTPNANYNGPDSFSYRVTDSDGGVAVATVSITVTPVNDAPTVSSPIAAQTGIDSAAFGLNVAGNFADPDGDSLSYSASGLPAGLSIDPATGLISGTLAHDASTQGPNGGGVYTVTITADDGHGTQVAQSFTLSVSNPPPLTNDSAFTTAEGSTLSGVLIASDIDGDTLSFSVTQQPAHGTLALAQDGTFTYTPDALYSGPDSFSYQVTDSDGGVATAVVSIDVGAVNHPPVANAAIGAQSATDAGAFSLNVAGNFSDADGDTLTYSASGLPAGLSIDPATGLISGTLGGHASTQGPNGAGVYTVLVTVSDGNGGSIGQSFTLSVSNPAPSTANSTVSVAEDTPYSGQLNATDLDGDALTFSVTTPPLHGNLVLNTDGSFTYTPAPDYNGPDSFAYQVTDGDGGIATAVVSVSVSTVNDAPTGVGSIAAQTAADSSAFSLNVSGNFSDVDGDALTFSASGLPAGLAIDPATGLISGTLAHDASTQGPMGGAYTVIVTASDGNGGQVDQTFTLTVNNPAPSTANSAFTTAEDTAYGGVLLATDVDGDTVTFSVTQRPAHGDLMLDADGTFLYRPALNYNGPDSFTYQVVDSDGGIATAVVNIVVSAVNDIPTTRVIVPQSAADGAPFSLDVSGNFYDADGDALTYSASGLPVGLAIDPATGLISGTLSSSASTQGPNGAGVYSVTLSVDDGQGGVVSQTFTLTVSNPLPSTSDSSLSTAEDTPYSGVLLATDPDGDSLAFSVAQQPAHGSLVLNPDGSFTYTPAANYNGPDSFTYRVTDSDGGASTAVVSISVSAVNDAPTPVGSIAAQNASDSAGFSLNVAGAFNDADGDTLTYGASGLPAGLAIDPATGLISGTLASSASTQGPNGGGTYTVIVTASDGNGGSVDQTFTLTVSNPPPGTANASFALTEDTPFSGALLASDPDGDALTFTATRLPLHGTLALNPDGTFTYTPVANYNGPDSFTYQVRDADGGLATATVTLAIAPVNDAPVANDDRATTLEDTPVTIDVLANDTDVDGDRLSVVAASAANGTVTLNPDGTLTYTPNANFNGTDVITYTLSDGAGLTASAQVIVTVVPVNDAPAAAGSIAAQSASDGAGFSLAVGGTFTDADGDVLAYSANGLPAGLSIDPVTGVISGTLDGHASTQGPNGGGAYTVVVTASDTSGGTASQTFVLTVSNPPPSSANSSFSTDENTAYSGALLASDPDGDALTFSVTQAPAHGSLVLNPDGTFTYLPAAQYSGTDRFNYQVVDSDGGIATAQVTITVTAVNDAPVPVGSIAAQSANDSTAFTLNVSGNFADADGDALTYSASGLPAGLSIDPTTGLISGTLANNASTQGPNGAGTYTVVVTANDGQGGSVDQTFTLTANNPAPVTRDSSVTTDVDTPLSGALVANDVDGDALTFSVIQAPAQGSLVLNPDGTFTYTPASGYSGPDSFSYQVTDSDRGVATAVVTIDVGGTNHAPVTTGPIATQSATDAGPFSLNVAGTFNDADGDTLTYSASGLPAGLAVDPATGLISGTLANNASTQGLNGSGAYTVIVAADDGNGGRVEQLFTLNVSNPAPSTANSAFSTASDTAYSGALVASDVDGDALTFSLTQAPTHGSLVLNPDGTFTYTPAGAYAGPDRFTYQVRDADGGLATAVVNIDVTAVNQGPIASGSIAAQSANDGAGFSLNVAGNFSDADGDVLTYSASGLPAGLSLDPATGLISGTLASSASTQGPNGGGFYSVTVTASDGNGGSAQQTFTLSVSNPAPSTANSAFSTAEGTSYSGALVASDIDGDALTFSVVQSPLHGSLTINPDGTFTYTPVAGYSGADRFSYQVRDVDGGVATALVNISVTAVNSAPTTNGNIAAQSANDGAAFNLNVAGTFSDADGDTLTYSVSGLPAGLSLDPATGLISGTLAHDASSQGLNGSGVYTLTVTADDGHGGTASQSFTLSVSNPPPVTRDSSVTTDANTPLNGVLVATDVDGDPLSFSVLQQPAHGSLALNADGTFTYTPASGYSGPDSFSYQVTDSDGGVATAVVTIDVGAANHAPVSTGPIATQSASDAGPFTLNVAGNFSDADGDPLTYSASGLPAGLSIDPATGLISGTLANNASTQGLNGSGAYTVVVAASDGNGGRVELLFTLNVSNPAPTTANSSFSTAEDTPYSGQLNASDVDGDALTFSVTQAPTHGSLVLNADGSFTYTPTADYNGPDSFTYQVRDADGGLATAVVSLSVTPENDAPTATGSIPTQSAADGGSFYLNVGGNFSDADGDVLTYSASGLPDGLSIDPATGLISGTLGGHASTQGPNGGGAYTVTLTVSDGNGGTLQQTFVLNVGNPPPTTANSAFTTAEDTAYQGTLVASDSDGDAFTFSVAQPPAHGTLVLNADGTFTYTPATDYTGADSFTYQVVDSDGGIATAVVSIVVTSANDAPVANGAIAAQTATDSSAFTLNVSGNFTDPDGDSLTYSASGLPAGLGIDSATGLISGTLGSSASQVGNGVYTITVTASDGSSQVAQVFTLTVTNPAPVASDSSIEVAADGTYTGQLPATDPDGDALTFSTLQAPANGTLTLNADGSFTYVPAAGYSGADSFVYQVVDADGASATATVTVTVGAGTGTNRPPVASDSTATTAEDTPLTLDPLATASDPDGDPLTVTAASAGNGSVVINPDGTLTYTPNPDFNGSDTLTYTLSDGAGGTVTANVAITITAVNDAPTVTPSSATTPEDTAITLDVLSNVKDVDSPVLTVTSAAANNGTTVVNPDGSVTYTPTANYTGTDTLTYTVSDGAGGFVTGTVTITVTPTQEFYVAPTPNSSIGVARVLSVQQTTVFTRTANYEPVLLDVINGFRRLEGMTVVGDEPMREVANGLQGLGNTLEITPFKGPMSQAVGDLNERSRQPLDVNMLRAGPFGTGNSAATLVPQQSVPSPANFSLSEPMVILDIPDTAPADTLLAHDAAERGDIALTTHAPPTLEEQLQTASQMRSAQLEELAWLLAG